MLYKILETLPREAQKDGSVTLDTKLPITGIDAADGFIHLSTASQAADTLNKYFGNKTKLYILHIDLPDNKDTVIEQGKPGNRPMGVLKWDYVGSRDSWFGHIYGHLLNGDVVQIQELNRDEGSLWQFPL